MYAKCHSSRQAVMVAVSVSVAASYNMVTRAGIQAEQDPAPDKLSQKSLPDSHIQLVSQQFFS